MPGKICIRKEMYVLPGKKPMHSRFKKMVVIMGKDDWKSKIPFCPESIDKTCASAQPAQGLFQGECDSCSYYKGCRKPYTEEGATRNARRRVLSYLDKIPEEEKDKIAEDVAKKIFIEIFRNKTKDIQKPKIHKKKQNKKIKINLAPAKVHSIGPIPLKDTDKRYCLSCLYLPNNCICGVKINGELTEIHITDKACREYKDQVF